MTFYEKLETYVGNITDIFILRKKWKFIKNQISKNVTGVLGYAKYGNLWKIENIYRKCFHFKQNITFSEKVETYVENITDILILR